MTLLSTVVSVTRYRLEGRLDDPPTETVTAALKKNTIREIDGDSAEKSIGWTSFRNSFNPDFEGSSFVFGTWFLFSLRIDKKTIPAAVLKKHCRAAEAKRLAETKRDFLSKSERAEIRDAVMDRLSTRIPASPSVTDLLWSYEEGVLWLFTVKKTTAEDFETLFMRTFKLTPIRLFPYTMADTAGKLPPESRDLLPKLTPTAFV